MPELPEVESYRRLAERLAVGRIVVDVAAPDPWYLKGGLDRTTLASVLHGARLVGARRRGKVALLDTNRGHVLGLRFGMTGRLLVDGVAGVDRLQHASTRDEPAWDRVCLRFAGGGELVVRDPRRLGGVLLDPDLAGLGPDAAAITLDQLRRALDGSAAPLKARLLDQSRVAGIGNLIGDEVLWRSGLAPARPAGGLSAAEVRRLHRHLAQTLADLVERGGSHLGDLVPARVPGGRCPRDGAPLRRTTVGGRTSWWCPRHQR